MYAVFGVCLCYEFSKCVDDVRFMIEPHMKRRLRSILKVGIPEGLFSESVHFSELGTVVFIQPDVQPEIRLVSRGDKYTQRIDTITNVKFYELGMLPIGGVF